MSLSYTDLVVGRKYAVKFRDCCISGEFQGTLQSVEKDDIDQDPEDFYFATFKFDVGEFSNSGAEPLQFQELGDE
jgi:hypothetical protein